MFEGDQDIEPTRRDLLKQIGEGLAVMTALGMVLTACGKKSPPKPPSGEDAPYPRKYPAPE